MNDILACGLIAGLVLVIATVELYFKLKNYKRGRMFRGAYCIECHNPIIVEEAQNFLIINCKNCMGNPVLQTN